jgi:hypothetical protein
VNENSFPALALVDLGSDGDTGRLEEAANTLIEVRDYLFYDVEAPASPYDSKEPASPQNMVDLRGYLERVHRKLVAVIDFYGAGEQDGTSARAGPTGAAPSGGRPTASKGIRQAGQAARETLLAARQAARITKGVAEDWDRVRDDLSRSAEKWATYRVLLDSQQEVEAAISVLASRLREFVRIVKEMGNSGQGQAASGRAQRRPSRGPVMDGRLHYMPWQPPSVGRAS